MTKKLIFKVYPCHFCEDKYFYPPDKLFWSEIHQGWVCDDCWSNRENHWVKKETPNGVSFLTCDRGISLEMELASLIY